MKKIGNWMYYLLICYIYYYEDIIYKKCTARPSSWVIQWEL
jgi:hypothetical protein